MRCNQARTVRLLAPALSFSAFQTGCCSTALCAENDTTAPSGCGGLGWRTHIPCLLEFADLGRQIGGCTRCPSSAFLRIPRVGGMDNCAQCAQLIGGGVFTN
jgi:hypothetical protein